MSYYSHPGSSGYPHSYTHPNTSAYPGYPQPTSTYPTAAYQAAYPSTTVSPYNTTWSYHSPYSYYPQAAHTQQAQTTAHRSAVATAPSTSSSAPTATNTHAPAVPPPAQRTSTTTTSSYIPYTPRDTVSAAASGGVSSRGRKPASYKGLFAKELRNLMYGFGDDRNPANDTVNVMEEILVEYIIDVCQTALAPGKKSRLSIEDVRRALSRPADAKKLARMEELLFMQEDIKRGRAQFDVNQVSSLSN